MVKTYIWPKPAKSLPNSQIENNEYVQKDESGNLDELNCGHRPETVARRYTKTSGGSDTQAYINKFV